MNNKISLEFEAKLEKAVQAMKTASSTVKVMSNEVRATQTSFKSASNQLSMFSSYNKQLKGNLESISKSLKNYRTALTKLENAEAKGANKQLQINAINKYKEAISILVKEQAKQQAQLATNQKLEETYKMAGVKNSQELIEQKQKEKQVDKEIRAEEKKKATERKQADKERKQAAKDALEIERLEKENLKETKEKIIELGTAIKSTLKGFNSGLALPFKTIISGMSQIGTSCKGVFSGLSKIGTSIKTKFIDQAINYSEELNLFNVVFGNIEKNGKTTFSELGKEATQFQNQLNEAFGTNKMETMRYQGLYQSMGESAGLNKQAAYMMSENMTKLGYDLASLFNTTEQKAMESLRAGVFAGQTKPLRGYGIDVTQQTYKPVLADLGIDKKVSELSQAEKEVLRYIVAIRQATAAQGDFADTIESPANQLKVMKQQMVELGVAIGRYFIAPFQRALQVINGVIMALKSLINFFAQLFGIQEKQYNAGYSYNDGLEDYSDGLDDVGNSASSTAKKMKELNRQVLAFDQINNLTTPTPTSSSGSGGTGGGNYGIDERLLNAMSGYENQMEKVRMKAVEIRDTIMEWLGFTKEVDEETKAVSFSYDTLNKSIEQILGEIGTNAGKGLNKLTESISWDEYGKKLAEGLNSAFALINSFVQTYDWKNLGTQIANFINNAIANINFSALGKILSNKFRVAILSLSGFLQRLNFEEIGKGIAETINSAIKNIPISELIDGLNALANGIFVALKTIFKEVDWNGLIKNIFEVLKGLDFKTHMLLLVPAIVGGLKGLFGSSLIKSAISEGIGNIISSKITNGKTKIDTGNIGSMISGSAGKMDLDIQKFAGSAGGIDFKGVSKEVLKGFGILAEIIGGVSLIILAYGELTRIPGFEKYISKGAEELKLIFNTIKEIILPLTGISALIVGLGALAEAVPVGILALAAILLSITALVEAYGALSEMNGFTQLITSGGQALNQLAEIIGGFAGTLLGSAIANFNESIMTTFDSLGTHLSALWENGKTFFEGAKTIDDSTTQGIKNLAAAILLITAQQVLDGIFAFVTGGSSLEKFGKQLPKFGENLKKYYDNVKEIKGGIITASANSAKALAELESLVPRQAGLAQLFAGSKSLLLFGAELPSFGANLKKYSDNIAGIKGSAVVDSATAAKSLAELESNIPNKAGLWQLCAGTKSLLLFGAELPAFGTFLKQYANNVAGIKGDVVTSSANSAMALAELANSVPRSQSLFSAIFTGDKSLKNFGEQIEKFGESLGKYSKSISQFDISKANQANSVVKTILDMLERANTIGISETVKNLQKGVKTYTDTISDFIGNAFSGNKVSTDKGAGYSMGQNIGSNIKSGIKNKLKDISLKVTDSSGKNVSSFTVKAYANGGLPEMGQLFFANEAGPEMVGKIGNRTAVANNDQIVTAIRGGVYDAVSNAMKNSGFGSVDIQLHTDEGVIVDRINKITRQTGTCPINI